MKVRLASSVALRSANANSVPAIMNGVRTPSMSTMVRSLGRYHRSAPTEPVDDTDE